MRPTRRRAALLVAAVVAAGVALPVGAPPAAAVTSFVVDTTADTVDASPGDGTCADAGGDCSLRAAVMEANALAGPDEIVLPAGTYVLTRPGADEDAASTGDLDVLDDLAIVGAGAATTTIDADELDRVLHASGDWDLGTPGAPLSVEAVTITGGRAAYGGGISVEGGGLVLRDAVVDGNRAQAGELACCFSFGGGVLASGGVTVEGTTISNNSVSADESFGGGLAVLPAVVDGGPAPDAPVVITGSVIEDNSASSGFPAGAGGGISVEVSGGTSVTISDTVVARNSVGSSAGPELDETNGGGIALRGLSYDVPIEVVVERATITGNVGAIGGGIAATGGEFEAATEIIDSTITGNGALIGGGVASIGGIVSVATSTIAGNTALDGGGIAAPYDFHVVRVERSTISGNVAAGRGGGTYSEGWASSVSLDTSTVSGNEAATGGGAYLGDQSFGGVHASTITGNSATTAGGVMVDGAIVDLGQTGNVIADQLAGADCAGAAVLLAVPIRSGGSNADSDGTCGFSEPTDQPGVDPRLGPLADNGGPTLTHLPAYGSPLVDAGGTCSGSDQRGVARPIGAACDVGAVEGTTSFLDVDTTVDSVDASPGDGVCADWTGECSLRSAIMEANALAAAELHVPEEIVLPAGAYELTLAGAGEDAGATGDLDLHTSLVLRGAGAGLTTIDAGGIDRVVDTHLRDHLDLLFPAHSVTLEDLRITGGLALDGLGGGGVRSAASTLTLRRVVVDHNRADGVDVRGGGVLFAAGWDVGGSSVELDDVTVDANEVVGPGAGGGGLWSEGGVTVTGGSFTGNLVRNDDPGGEAGFPSLGGGLGVLAFVDDPAGLPVAISGTTFSGNGRAGGAAPAPLSGGGVGLGAEVRATISGSSFEANTATLGGGLALVGDLAGAGVAVSGSSFAGNVSLAGAGGEEGLGGGIGVFGASSDVIVETSTVSGNRAARGGGIGTSTLVSDLPRALVVRRSTVSGNTASVAGGGIGSYADLTGFFPSVNEPELVVDTTTISGNVAPVGAGIVAEAATGLAIERTTLTANAGGGLAAGAATLTTAPVGTVVADQAAGSDCAEPLSASGGWNADGDGTCGFTDVADLPGVDPMLGPLADNGGSTLTHLPAVGSPLLEAGGPCTGTDQRGLVRPQGLLCDVGAIEVVAPVFSDVGGAHPFGPSIASIALRGIAGGWADGTFRPGWPVSRQAAVTWLWRAAGSPAGPFADPGFSDVPADHPFAAAIAWAAHTGLTGGWPDGTFRPAAHVSRQAAVVWLWRSAGAPAGPFADPGFVDVPAGHPFATAIAWGAQVGLVAGYPDGTFRPGGVVTRQALAAWLAAA